MGLLGKKLASLNFNIPTVCLWGLWERDFFCFCCCRSEEVFKAPPAAMDVCLMKKTPCCHNSMDCKYWQSCACLFHPSTHHEVLGTGIEGQNCCTTKQMEYGPLHCTTLSSPGWTSCAHNQAHSDPPAIPSTSIQPIAVQNHTTSIVRVCAMPLLTEGHGWNGWMFPWLSLFYFFYLSNGSFGGSSLGENAYLGAVSLFAYPFLKCITILFTISTHVMLSFAYHNKNPV